MDSWQNVFRNLTFGTKFDFKRFQNDAEKLKLLRESNHVTVSKEETRSLPKVRADGKGLSSSGSTAAPCKRRRLEDDNEDIAKCSKADVLVKDDDKSDESSPSSMDEDESDDDDNEDEDNDDDKEDEDDDDDAVKDGKDSGDEDNDSNEDDDNDDDDAGDDSSSGDEIADENIGDNAKSRVCKIDTTDRKNRKKNQEKSPAKLAQIRQEQVNHFRNERHIQVFGEDIPDPVSSFQELAEDYSINPKIMSNLDAMGFKIPTDIETQALPVMLHRREIIACAPTGSGKTLAFVLPILHHLKEPTDRRNNLRALILAPTIELAKQIHRELSRVGAGLGFHIKFIEKVSKELKQTAKKPRIVDILVTTPNRLVYLMKENPEIMSLKSVEWLVIDECDKLFEDGKSGFREQLGSIYKACSSKDIRRGLFSATFANDVKEWCLLNLDNVVQVYIGARNAATHAVDQQLVYAGDEGGKLMALREVIRQGFQPPVLIFVQSKDRAKDLFLELFYDKVNVEVIHGDKTQTQRDKIVADFRSGKIWILICTEVMGRGIDFKGVNLVINYDFPNSAVSYIHRIGRTGRAGRRGKAITYFANNDIKYLKCIVNVMREAGCEVPDYMLRLKPLNRTSRKKLAKSAIKRQPINLQRLISKKEKKNRMKKKQLSVHEDKVTLSKQS